MAARLLFPTHLLVTIRAAPVQLKLRRRGAHTHTHTHYVKREASGGDLAESGILSLSKRGLPSTLAVLEIGKASKLAAKDLVAATLQGEGSACLCSNQQPDEVGSSTPASGNLHAENDQQAPRRPSRCVPCFGGHLQELRRWRRRGAPADVSGDTRWWQLRAVSHPTKKVH